MKANDFVSKLVNIANNVKTVYAWGMFGAPITKLNVHHKAKQYPSWYTDSKISTVFAPLYGSNPQAWGFDCVGLIKGVLWGWNGETDKTYGGAIYGSNGVSDVSADAMIERCLQVGNNFNSIAVGEYLWMKGHCGIYIGNGQVVESSPKWKNGVQITKLSDRNWLKHGRLPFVTYNVGEEVSDTVSIELSLLRKGSKGEEVKTLQRLLNAFGSKLDIDGSFGPLTQTALRNYQALNKLEVDGVCGVQTWTSLLK